MKENFEKIKNFCESGWPDAAAACPSGSAQQQSETGYCITLPMQCVKIDVLQGDVPRSVAAWPDEARALQSARSILSTSSKLVRLLISVTWMNGSRRDWIYVLKLLCDLYLSPGVLSLQTSHEPLTSTGSTGWERVSTTVTLGLRP